MENDHLVRIVYNRIVLTYVDANQSRKTVCGFRPAGMWTSSKTL